MERGEAVELFVFLGGFGEAKEDDATEFLILGRGENGLVVSSGFAFAIHGGENFGSFELELGSLVGLGKFVEEGIDGGESAAFVLKRKLGHGDVVADDETVRGIDEGEVEEAVMLEGALVVLLLIEGLGGEEADGVKLAIFWVFGGPLFEIGGSFF